MERYLSRPELIYQISYQELKSLVVQYPYAHNLRYLLLRKSYLEEHGDSERHLHLTATYAPDREHLHHLLEKATSGDLPPTDLLQLDQLIPKDRSEEALLDLSSALEPEPVHTPVLGIDPDDLAPKESSVATTAEPDEPRQHDTLDMDTTDRPEPAEVPVDEVPSIDQAEPTDEVSPEIEHSEDSLESTDAEDDNVEATESVEDATPSISLLDEDPISVNDLIDNNIDDDDADSTVEDDLDRMLTALEAEADQEAELRANQSSDEPGEQEERTEAPEAYDPPLDAQVPIPYGELLLEQQPEELPTDEQQSMWEEDTTDFDEPLVSFTPTEEASDTTDETDGLLASLIEEDEAEEDLLAAMLDEEPEDDQLLEDPAALALDAGDDIGEDPEAGGVTDVMEQALVEILEAAPAPSTNSTTDESDSTEEPAESVTAPTEIATTPLPESNATPVPKTAFVSWLGQLKAPDLRAEAAPFEKPASTKPAKQPIEKRLKKVLKHHKKKTQKKKKKKNKRSTRIIEFASKSLEQNEAVVSDTLAKLLVVQKQYEEALWMYGKLLEKYPDRQAYYQAQIDHLKEK